MVRQLNSDTPNRRVVNPVRYPNSGNPCSGQLSRRVPLRVFSRLIGRGPLHCAQRCSYLT